jgi:hypothetical protein
MDITKECSHEEWQEKTQTIRKWLDGGAVPSKKLKEELQAWADYIFA